MESRDHSQVALGSLKKEASRFFLIAGPLSVLVDMFERVCLVRSINLDCLFLFPPFSAVDHCFSKSHSLSWTSVWFCE
jgi:hypothetical protein